MNVTEICKVYCNKPTLTPEDVVKCYLSIYQASGKFGYDKKLSLWKMRPGDLIYIDGKFRLLLMYPRVDYKQEKGCFCYENTTLKSKCECVPWYLYYKNDRDKVKFYKPAFNGLTLIYSKNVKKTLQLLKNHPDYAKLKKHFECKTLKPIIRAISQKFQENL